MNNQSGSARRGLSFTYTKLLSLASIVLLHTFAATNSAWADKITGTPLEKIDGFKTTKQVASPHVFFVSFGPALPENELKRLNKLLPQWTSGAGYRISFVGQGKYVDLVIELIASGEEGAPKKVINSYWLNGSDLEKKIGIQDLNAISLSRWIDYRILLLQGSYIGGSPAEDVKKTFRITIRDNGIFDVDPIPQTAQ